MITTSAASLFTIEMNLMDCEQTTRIILENRKHIWRMTVGDTAVVAELLKSVMLAPAGLGESVKLEGGGFIGFCRTDHGANVGGTVCERADAIRLASDLLKARDDAQRHLQLSERIMQRI